MQTNAASCSLLVLAGGGRTLCDSSDTQGREQLSWRRKEAGGGLEPVRNCPGKERGQP